LKEREDLIFTALSNFLRIITGPLTLLFIPRYLNSIEQGYWYFFGSLSALSILADFGFSNIVMQFTSHEKGLNYEDQDKAGKVGNKSTRISSLLKYAVFFTLKWSIWVFLGILLLGIFFLFNDDKLDFLLSWVIFSFGSFLSLNASTILSFLEGYGEIAFVQKARILSSLISSLVLLCILYFGGGIYALSYSILLASSVLIFVIFYRYGGYLIDLFTNGKSSDHDWGKEFSPLLGKYFVSFFSGYLIFQLFVPLSKFRFGIEFSGKVGITFALFTAIFTLSNVWIYTIMPRLSELSAIREFSVSRRLFNRRFTLMILTYLGSLVVFCIILIFVLPLLHFEYLTERFLSIESFIILAIVFLCQLVINSWATAIRALKREEFHYLSLVLAIYIPLTTWFSSNYLSEKYFLIGFLTAYLWSVPWAYRLYRRFIKS